MHSILVDLLLFGFIYTLLLCILFLYKRNKNSNDTDNDEDGGIPAISPPKLDLPPGICLPDGPMTGKKEQEEALV